jgi:hypothetical protein
MNMQHGHDINNIDTDLKYGNVRNMQHGQVTGTRSMDLDKQLWHSFVLFSLAILENFSGINLFCHFVSANGNHNCDKSFLPFRFGEWEP